MFVTSQTNSDSSSEFISDSIIIKKADSPMIVHLFIFISVASPVYLFISISIS